MVLWCCLLCFFFFKQKTAYEMVISDWSSDVCSSDLANGGRFHHIAGPELDCVRAMQSDVERAPDIALRGRRKACELLHFLQGRRAVIASVNAAHIPAPP